MQNIVQEDFAERVRVNQQQLSLEHGPRFDYIVCGAGTSGCVVAARLAADLKTEVLLLEAGGSDETDLITNPNRWPMTLGSELDWKGCDEMCDQLSARVEMSTLPETSNAQFLSVLEELCTSSRSRNRRLFRKNQRGMYELTRPGPAIALTLL